MIRTKKITIDGKEYIKTYSSKKFYIKDSKGFLYPAAYNLIDYEEDYTESDILIK